MDNLHVLILREMTPLLVESLAWGTRKRTDYVRMVQALELWFILNLFSIYVFQTAVSTSEYSSSKKTENCSCKYGSRMGKPIF